MIQNVAIGGGALTIALLVLSAVADLAALLGTDFTTLSWAAGGVVLGLGLIVAVGSVRSGIHRFAGLMSIVMIVGASGLLGWIARPDPLRPDVVDPPQPPPVVRILAPENGARVDRCIVEVRFLGEPSKNARFIAATKQLQANYYFEANVTRHAASDEWRTTVQLGNVDLDDDEGYAIIVYQIADAWTGYLSTVMRSDDEPHATWWTTADVPPGTSPALATVNVERDSVDPGCPV